MTYPRLHVSILHRRESKYPDSQPALACLATLMAYGNSRGFTKADVVRLTSTNQKSLDNYLYTPRNDFIPDPSTTYRLPPEAWSSDTPMSSARPQPQPHALRRTLIYWFHCLATICDRLSTPPPRPPRDPSSIPLPNHCAEYAAISSHLRQWAQILSTPSLPTPPPTPILSPDFLALRDYFRSIGNEPTSLPTLYLVLPSIPNPTILAQLTTINPHCFTLDDRGTTKFYALHPSLL